MGLTAYANLDSGELLASQFRHDGLDAVVAACAAVGTDPQPTGLQGNIVKEDDNPGRGNVKVGGKLQNAFAGEVHIGLGLQQKNLSAAIECLTVKTLEFEAIHLTAKVLRQNIQTAEARVVAGVGIILAGVAKTHDEPAFISLTNHISIDPPKVHT